MRHHTGVGRGCRGKVDAWVNQVDDNDWEHRRKQELGSMQAERDRAAREARTDALTGLLNARAYHEQLSAIDTLTRQAEHHYAVVFYDADDFHVLNRERGDAAGDEVLRQITALFSESCRAGDWLFRKGGEEFVAFLPDTTLHEALEAAERTRQAVEDAAIPSGVPDKVVTISVGVAYHYRDRHNSLSDVVEEASQAMKLAKDAGRNRVRSYSPCSSDRLKSPQMLNENTVAIKPPPPGARHSPLLARRGTIDCWRQGQAHGRPQRAGLDPSLVASAGIALNHKNRCGAPARVGKL